MSQSLQGSSRSGILGEATVNMALYMNSKASSPLSLPLDKCHYGTVLQVSDPMLLMLVLNSHMRIHDAVLLKFL